MTGPYNILEGICYSTMYCLFVGYEKYNLIRQDPTLCFLVRCGPPDGQALLREQNDEDNEDG